MKLILIFYLTQYIKKHLCNQYKISNGLLPVLSVYEGSDPSVYVTFTFQFRGASFQSLHRHTWQVVNVLEIMAPISLSSQFSGKFSPEYYLISSIFSLLLDFFFLAFKLHRLPLKALHLNYHRFEFHFSIFYPW